MNNENPQNEYLPSTNHIHIYIITPSMATGPIKSHRQPKEKLTHYDYLETGPNFEFRKQLGIFIIESCLFG